VRIFSDTPVRTSTTAQLEPLGLTGVSLVQLTAGDPDDRLVRRRPGKPVPQIPGKPGQFEDILAAGQIVAARAADVLASVQTLLSPQNVARLNAVLADVEAITNELERNKAFVGEAREAVRQLTQTAASIDQTATAFETLALNANTTLDGLAGETDLTLKQARQTLTALESAANAGTDSLQRIEGAVEVAANETLPELSLAAQDLRRLSAALENVAENLNEDPANFVFGSRKPTVELKK
jgi:phospholipid/cholesterol/gamma-HCH transport system substrate-binding protein